MTPITDDTVFHITPAGLHACDHAPIIPDEPDQADALNPYDEDTAAAQGLYDEAPTNEPGFTPDTKEKADWVLSKIADAKGRAARIREHAETMAKQAEAEATFFEWKYGAALQDFARKELAGGRRKSLTLYHGVIGFKSKPAGCQIGDSKAALVWAKEFLPGAVIETFDRKAVTKALMETGEAVDFAAFTLGEEVFFIK